MCPTVPAEASDGRVRGRERATAAPSQHTEYRICTRCVMDTSDENIAFDELGRCAHCTSYEREAHGAGFIPPELQAERLAIAVAEIKRAGRGHRYDCLIGLSGGVDSSYVALCVRNLGLRPLAVHLDNGWNSEEAVANIERVVRGLGIDLFTWVLDWDEFRELQLAFLRAATPDYEIPTDHAIVAANFKTAWRFRIPWLVMGHNVASELVLPSTWAQGHFDWRYIRSVHSRFAKRPLDTFPHLDTLGYLRFRRTVARRTLNILNYIPYDRTKAIAELELSTGWRDYGGKHYESIYTRFIQGYVLPTKFGIDKRRAHLAALVLAGLVTRDYALAELAKPTYPCADLLHRDRLFVLKKLGLSDAEFAEIMATPRRTGWDFASMFNSPSYRGVRAVYRGARAVLGRGAV